MGFKPVPAAIALAIGLLIWFVIPVPEGVASNAWHLLALFVATIAAIIGKAMPIGALSILAISLVALTGVTSDKPAVAIFGKRTLGIGYALALSELTIAPVTPSNTARGGAIMHPIMRAIAGSFDSDPKDGTQGRIGKYLALVNYHANPITSAMFITATAPNPLIVKLVAEATGAKISISWGMWALAMLLPGLAAIALMPLVLYWLFPPEIKSTPDAAQFARGKLAERGPLHRGEKVMLGVFVLLLLLWAGVPEMIFGSRWAVDSTTTAFIGLGVLLLTGVLDWEDVLKEKSAWDTIVWFSALVMMATYLNKLGLIAWFSSSIEHGIGRLGLDWVGASALLLLAYLYAHYLFASTTAHITAMFAAFYGTGIALGAPALPFALLMAAASNIMMSLTHYATGTSPVIFGSGYTTLGEWWKAGFVMSLVLIGVWLVVGGAWWKLLGYW